MRKKNTGLIRWRALLRGVLWVTASVLLGISLLLILFRSGALPTTAFMLQHKLDTNKAALRHQWLRLADISPAMQLAVIAGEDAGFAHHRGIEWYATRAAITAALGGKHAPGGSTITQQLAKNLFLWPGRSYLRKGIELAIAPLIEVFWSKQRILEVYLNVAQFSARDYGIATASQYLLKKKAARLNRYEAALLAAALPAPARFNPARPGTRLKARQRKILANMSVLQNQRTLEYLRQR